ncbi:MAG: 16S rRNA (cytosine(1402)-N(4))-methyltransferase RsmH [Bacillota bacterium]
MEFAHTPVLLRETIEHLNINPNGVYVDCTVGGAGHSLAIAKRLSPAGVLVGIDQDPAALRAAGQQLASISAKVHLVHANFSEVSDVLDGLNIKEANGFIFDLGVSSHQLEEAERGFAYMQEAPLDMRMDPARQTLTAKDLVNSLSEVEIAKLLWEYGEERWAKRIAAFIVEQRALSPVETTHDLVSIVKAAIPKGARKDGPHPAKRTFQAFRIAVNRELEHLEMALNQITYCLVRGGRLCVITFHSLEDRIVKQKISELASSCSCSREIPFCVCNKKPLLRPVSKKPIIPCAAEIAENPRARSAKLRVAERI